jgi:hypothetical protein
MSEQSRSQARMQRALLDGKWPQKEAKWRHESLNDPTTGVKLLFLTWNMKGLAAPDDVSDILLLDCRHHIYCVSTQECSRPLFVSVFYSSMDTWEQRVLSSLGPEYALLASDSLGGVHLMLIAHLSLQKLISNISLSTICTGFFNLVPNKGAVAITFTLFMRSFLVIGCHLTSGNSALAERNNDAYRIDNELEIGTLETKPVSERFNCTVLFGDLNYRINGTNEAVRYLISDGEKLILQKWDELVNEMQQGRVAFGFREAEVEFPPTYKFKKWKYSKKRVPAWTDRVLVKDRDEIMKQVSYGAVMSSEHSDHKPVYAQFLMRYG